MSFSGSGSVQYCTMYCTTTVPAVGIPMIVQIFKVKV